MQAVGWTSKSTERLMLIPLFSEDRTTKAIREGLDNKSLKPSCASSDKPCILTTCKTNDGFTRTAWAMTRKYGTKPRKISGRPKAKTSPNRNTPFAKGQLSLSGRAGFIREKGRFHETKGQVLHHMGSQWPVGHRLSSMKSNRS